MKKLMFATFAVLSIGSGAALAQEADAQFLRPDQIPTPTYQWLPNAASGYVANPMAPRAGSVTTMFGQSHRLDVPALPVYDGSDGNGG